LAYRGTTGSRVLFGTTTSFGIPNINGQAAKVMTFPACASSEGFFMSPGAAPNGGGHFVNQYTLIMDVLIPSTSTGYGAFLQTDSSNASDADLFVDPSNGIGVSGEYYGNLTPNVWHRLAFTVDLTKRELGKFIDGTNYWQQDLGSAEGGVDQRWSLSTNALL